MAKQESRKHGLTLIVSPLKSKRSRPNFKNEQTPATQRNDRDGSESSAAASPEATYSAQTNPGIHSSLNEGDDDSARGPLFKRASSPAKTSNTQVYQGASIPSSPLHLCPLDNPDCIGDGFCEAVCMQVHTDGRGRSLSHQMREQLGDPRVDRLAVTVLGGFKDQAGLADHMTHCHGCKNLSDNILLASSQEPEETPGSSRKRKRTTSDSIQGDSRSKR